jgi:hypothetical protein
MKNKQQIQDIKKIIKQLDNIIEELEALGIFSVKEEYLAAKWEIEDGRDILITLIAELNEGNKQCQD